MVCVHKLALRFTNTIGLDSYLVQVSMGLELRRANNSVSVSNWGSDRAGAESNVGRTWLIPYTV